MVRMQQPLMRTSAPSSPKIERIVAAATRLVLAHGARKLTMAEIAAAAGVGKGTAYQYWAGKDDLILDLAVREMVSFLNDLAVGLRKHAERLTAGHVLRAGVECSRSYPVVSSLLARTDGYLLGLIAERTWSRESFAACSPTALCAMQLPILRTHGLLRDDVRIDEQVFVAVSMLLGFFTTLTADHSLAPAPPADPNGAFERAVVGALGPTGEVDATQAELAAFQIADRLDELGARLAAEASGPA